MTAVEEYNRPPTTQRAVLDELRRWLLSGKLVPGDRVLQDVVAREFNTSVIPVREALKTLESEGQLVHIPHRGFFVAELSRAELLELCEIRSVLEAMAVRRNLPHVTSADVAEMTDLIDRMQEADSAGDVVAMVQLDRRFHFTLFEAGGRNQLTRIITTTWEQSDPYRAAFFNDSDHRSTNHDEHRVILDAIVGGDSETVIALLDDHRLRPVASLPVTDEADGTQS